MGKLKRKTKKVKKYQMAGLPEEPLTAPASAMRKGGVKKKMAKGGVKTKKKGPKPAVRKVKKMMGGKKMMYEQGGFLSKPSVANLDND